MLLGRIFGKVTTTSFKFLVEHDVKKFDYIQVHHGFYDYVLCQVVEIEKQEDSTTGHCQVIGYKDKDGKIKEPRIPFEPDSEVFLAEESFIAQIISLDKETEGAYLGKLDGKDIPVYINLQKLLTKHVAVLAKSGAGKSYTVGVLLEEILDKKIPLLIIDPHGEYATLSQASKEDNNEKFATYNVTPTGFNVQEYGDTRILSHVQPLRLADTFSIQELVQLIPVKLNNTQLSLIHSAAQNLDNFTIDELLYNLNEEESNAKWTLISIIEQLRSQELFSSQHTPYHELVKPGQATIINGRGMDPDIIDLLVYKLTKDLFSLRKQEKIPPFFLVIEEAHNFCPERNFGEKKSSKILRTVASEGRKFGLGLCVVSQRPARVDKSVLSQCSTQLIMKITNPNDIKAVSQSVEGMTQYTEQELQHIPIGTALVTGVTEVPLFVTIRPRKSQHGGQAVNMLGNVEVYDAEDEQQEQSLSEQLEKFNEQQVLPIITQHHTKEDVALMNESSEERIQTVLLPVYQLLCQDKEDRYHLLIDATTSEVITDKTTLARKKLPKLHELTQEQLRILHFAFTHQKFSLHDLAASGSGLDTQEVLGELERRQYILKSEEQYTLNTEYIFSSLQSCQTYESFVYEKIGYDIKKEATLTLDEVVEMYQKFTTVQDHTAGYLITYIKENE